MKMCKRKRLEKAQVHCMSFPKKEIQAHPHKTSSFWAYLDNNINYYKYNTRAIDNTYSTLFFFFSKREEKK